MQSGPLCFGENHQVSLLLIHFGFGVFFFQINETTVQIVFTVRIVLDRGLSSQTIGVSV